jgi:PAS domain S-box-containing protein
VDSIYILLLEDSPIDAELTSAFLSRGGFDYSLERVDDRDHFLAALQQRRFDLILADYALTTFDGLSALELAREHARETPFIFVSGTLGEDIAIRSLQRGATDYVLKQKLERLAPAVTRALREAKERTERRRSQKELRESERRFRQLANAIEQLIWTTDNAAQLTYCNRRLLDYLGHADFDAARKAGFAGVHPEDRERVAEAFATGMAQGRRFGLQYRLRRASDGEYRWHWVTVVPMENESGEMGGWVGCATDIEDQKRNESVLIVSEKLAATGRLAASIAHEINNPLEAISNLLYILGTQERLSPEGSHYLSMAEHELMRAAQITKQTLGFYRENSGPAPFSLSDLINEVLVLYQGKLQHKGVEVELCGFDGAQVVATRGEVRQVFANLVGNAIDAVSHSGKITLILCKSRYQGVPGFEIAVKDNGTGIDPQIVDKIFQPFFTTKKSVGTGLGLWVCREIIEKHGGRISVSSNGGHGTGSVFSVFLPEVCKNCDNALVQSEDPAA